MATSELTTVGADDAEVGTARATPPTSRPMDARRRWGIIGQYVLLCALALLVLGPILLTGIQALSPPFRYVRAQRPLHPVSVAWKDRTWWSGGLFSVVVRTAVAAAALGWLQQIAGRTRRRRPADLLRPPALVAIVGGTVVLGIATGPVFDSLSSADGHTVVIFLLAGAVVVATQLWGYVDAARGHLALGVVNALLAGIGAVGLAVLFAGPEVWTSSWGQFRLGPAMVRSLIMAVLITVAQVATSITSAYAFVFLRFPLKRILFALFMATLLLPVEVTLVGNIATIRQLEWTNTMQALVLPFGATALGTFLIRQGFRGLPSEIRDATRLEGHGHIGFLVKFAVPLTRPVVASFTVISALSAWNQYLWPRAVIEKNSLNTLQIQLRSVAAGEVARANEAIAAALVAAVPVVILLVAFQRQIIRGLTAGAVK
ncbi:MAG: carbohydrate ABC transporter permease [Acidimicrobiales bacterium]